MLLAPNLPPGLVSDLDWYALDVAAADTYHRLVREAREHEQDTAEARRLAQQEARRRGRHRQSATSPTLQSQRGVVQESGSEGLIIRGTEIPPWERR